MRYAQGGGLTAERRQFRERIRYQAGERFARSERTAVIARDLRVSERSVERWRRAWQEGGMDALASTGPAKLPKVSDGQFAVLEEELALGPAEHGWEDQRWTLARVRTLIAGSSASTAPRRPSGGCCTGTAGPGSARPAARWNATSMRSSCGRRTCGRRWNDRGGAGGLHRLRGRGGVFHDTAASPHLGPTWADTRGPGAGPLLAPLVDRRHVLLQARRNLPADLPAAPPPQAQRQRTRQLLLARLPRPGGARVSSSRPR